MILPSGLSIEENRPLAPLTTLGLGGPARWFARVMTETQLVEAFVWARETESRRTESRRTESRRTESSQTQSSHTESGPSQSRERQAGELPIFILGGGSNLVVADSGFDGLVLALALRGVTRSFEGDRVLLRAAAGEPWDGFVAEAIALDCAGVECLAGIPGTVGGTPVQNVGAYGQEVAETIHRVRVLDRATLQFHEFSAAECGFAYRRSIFNSTDRDRYVVTAVEFALRLGGAPTLRYADLARAFAGQPPPSLAEVADKVRAIRRGKGMLLVPGDPDTQSAGSFFRNPVISTARYAALTEQLGAEPPGYPASPDAVKIPAAWLIERAGFARGFRMGNVAISSRHTLALVNCGQGTTAELLALRDHIADGVEQRFAIRLEMEPVLLGF